MARRTQLDPTSCQLYETGCTWRLHRFFDFGEGHSKKRLLFKRKHLNTNAVDAGNGNSRSRLDVLTVGDENYPGIAVSSKRGRDYGCKNFSCVKNDRVVYRRNRATQMIVDQKFVNGKYEYLGKDSAVSEPNQFFDALQILYSNRELFLNLLQDPNSLLLKQIHDFQDPQVKTQYLARQKYLTRPANGSRFNEPQTQTSNTRRCENPFKSLDRNHSRLSCNPESSSEKIVVLKPGPTIVSNFADTGCYCPSLHSHNSSSYNRQTVKPSHFPFASIKRKLRHAIGGRKKKQQLRTIDGIPHKFPCSSHDLEGDDKVIGLGSSGRNSLSNVSSDLSKGEKKIKVKDFEESVGQEAALLSESHSRNTNLTLISPFEKNQLNFLDEARRNISEMLNYRIEEYKQQTNTRGRTMPLHEFGFYPGSLGTDHDSVTEQMRFSHNHHHMVSRTKLGLQKQGENSWFSSLSTNFTDISIRKGLPSRNLYADNEIPEGLPSEPNSKTKDGLTRSFDMDNTIEEIGSFLDSSSDIQYSSFSSDVASSSPSTSRGGADTEDMKNKVEQPGLESDIEQFIKEDAVNPPSTISQPAAELSVQTEEVRDNFEEHQFADILVSPPDPSTSKDIPENVKEILKASSLKWDELMIKCQSSDQLLDLSTFDELKGLTDQLSSSQILFDCIRDVFVEEYQNLCRIPARVSVLKPNVHVVKRSLLNEVTKLIDRHFFRHPSARTLEQFVEMDLARRGSWLDVHFDVEDIAFEVEEDVLEELIVDIVCEMDTRNTILHSAIARASRNLEGVKGNVLL